MWPWLLCADSTRMQRTCNVIRSVTAGENAPPPPPLPAPFVVIIYASCFFCHKVMAANDVRVAAGVVWTLASWALACSPSLNSPRSNLQTAAEFWQILPRCFLPLGDTFFIYFSSPPLWYSLHGALAPQAIVSSVLRPCLKNQMDLQGLLSTHPFFLGLWMWHSLLFPLFYFYTIQSFIVTWSFFFLRTAAIVALVLVYLTMTFTCNIILSWPVYKSQVYEVVMECHASFCKSEEL